MIFTSYFANEKNVLGKIIAIANILPKNIQMDKYSALSPDIDLLSDYKQGKVDNKAFSERFYYQLDKLNAKQIYKDINNATLFCYEKPNEFCHRVLVRKWLAKHNKLAIEYRTAYELPIIIPKDYQNKAECFIILNRLIKNFNSNQKITLVSNSDIIKVFAAKNGLSLKKLDMGYNKQKADLIIVFSNNDNYTNNILNEYINVHRIFLIYDYDKKKFSVLNKEIEFVKNTLF